jgi:4-alpha-glucanotransferase
VAGEEKRWLADDGLPTIDDLLTEKPDVDAIAALVRRFPEHACSIRRLGAADATFRTICDDYGEALRALAHWQAADQSAQQRADEYRRMVKELEDEALAALKAYEGG